jgi:transposase
VKTDKRDARTLCQACHLGAYRPAHRCSDESRLLRKHLRAREALVQTRSRMISVCRAFLRQEGLRVPSGGAPSFAQRVRTLKLADELRETLAPLLEVHEQVCAQIDVLDEKVKQVVATDERVQRLTTVPSVGPVTAATFIAVVDDVARFESADKLQSYLGLVPREYSSGEKQQRGHITKAGNSRLRCLLVECAWGILRRRNSKSEALEQWATRIAMRRGKRIAAVALARRLAAILFAMTKHARSFEPQRFKPAAVAAAA